MIIKKIVFLQHAHIFPYSQVLKTLNGISFKQTNNNIYQLIQTSLNFQPITTIPNETIPSKITRVTWFCCITTRTRYLYFSYISHIYKIIIRHNYKPNAYKNSCALKHSIISSIARGQSVTELPKSQILIIKINNNNLN